MIAARQIAFGGGKRKPYDAEIEYLESTGTQYIDTGILKDSVKGIVASFAVTEAIENAALFGGEYNTAGRTLITRSGKFLYFGGAYNLGDVILNKQTDFDISESLVLLPRDLNLYIFSCGDGSHKSKARCYHLSLYDLNGILVRDLIPVRVSDVGYMYDRVSGQLFGNAGTGAFVLGSDI